MSLEYRRLALSLLLLVLLRPTSLAANPSTTSLEREGGIYEIDRRSHPAVDASWDELCAGTQPADVLRLLPELSRAEPVLVETDWMLIKLSSSDAELLRSRGVRLNPPRARPDAPPRIFPEEKRTRLTDPATDQSIAYAVNIDEMMNHLYEISTVLQTRYYNTQGMVSASQYVFDRLVEYGLDDVYFDDFSYNGYPVRNVIGIKVGQLYPDRIYIVCGHLDSTSPQNQTLAPGAEDNGTGSVGVVEAARLFAPLQTDATVYFVCFTAEEQGLVGSEHLAQIADQENWDLRGVLNMDMVGYDTAGSLDLWLEGFPSNPGSIALMDLLEDVANAYTDMGVYRYPGDGWGSDHAPFNQHGFPAILAIDYDWDNYPCYHQTCDVVDNLVPNQLRRMVVTVAVAAGQLSGVQSALGWIDGTADKTNTGDDAGVTIGLFGTNYPDAVSQGDGSFLLPDLLPGTYLLRASALGYATTDVNVTVLAGQGTPVTIPLDPLDPSIVSGHISIQEGGPLAGALVFASGQPTTTTSDELGAYTLDPIYPGEVTLNALYSDRLPGVAVVSVPAGSEITDVDFILDSTWDFEASGDGLKAGLGWEWGSDGVAGAHSGTKVWGTRLNTNYSNCADYHLDLPPFDLTYHETARLHFWHWYETESGYDGGNVQVSTDAGQSWSAVTPVGGYTNQLTGNCNALAGQSGYGGGGSTWSEGIVDLTSYVGQAVEIRFWFASDQGVRGRGWYIDDLSLEGTLQTTGTIPQIGHPNQLLSDLSIHPNPSVDGTTLRFSLGAAASTWLRIYDAGGRRVRTLLDDRPLKQGEQNLFWDSRDDAGRQLPAGVYWAQIFANGRTRQQRLTILR